MVATASLERYGNREHEEEKQTNNVDVDAVLSAPDQLLVVYKTC
jgi:hypothetical protein